MVLTIRRANAARGVLAGVLLSFLVFVLLVQYAPDAVAFSPNNYGWNGLREVSSSYSVNFTTTLSSLPPKSVLAILQPSAGFGSADVGYVMKFLAGGGTLLVADKSGFANSLLQKIGSVISIESAYSISDSVYNWRAKSTPTAVVLPSARANAPYLAKVRGLAVNEPSPLILKGPEAEVLAVTSQFSVIQRAGHVGTAQAVSTGPFTVMASQKIGSGLIIVVGDSQFLLNSEWTIADNRILIGNLFANRSIFIDASHWKASPLTSSTAQVKAELRQLYGLLSAIPARYAFVLVFVSIALVLVPTTGRGSSRTNNGTSEGG